MPVAKSWKLPRVSTTDTVGQTAGSILPVRVAETWSWIPSVRRRASAKTLHNLRISIKRLRYSMEIYAPCSGERFRNAIEEIKEAQRLLGRLHDRDVALQKLVDYLPLGTGTIGRNRQSGRLVIRRRLEEQALKRIMAKYRKERAELYRKFLAHWSRLGRRRVRMGLLNLLRANARLPSD